MDEHKWLAEQFEAYRMLGSLSEAADAVQESWLRLSRIDTNNIQNLGGWLTTVVARECLDMLRSRESRREESLYVRVTDPIMSDLTSLIWQFSRNDKRTNLYWGTR